MEALQIQPNHADHISEYKDEYLRNMFEREPVVTQLKYDGERMLMHIVGSYVFCTSRRFSKKTGRYMENQDKLPMLKEKIARFANTNPLAYTVLDCECYADTWAEAVGVLHSLPARAAELCKTTNIRFAVFDCLYENGEDIRDKQYLDRLFAARRVIEQLDFPQIHLVKFMDANQQICDVTKAATINCQEDWQRAMQNAIANRFEGVVIKSLTRKYYDKGASLKCKKFETLDLIVCDKQQGTGKYANTIGALWVGYYDPMSDNIVKVSKVNCSTDAERNYWRDNWDKLVGTVIEVKCQEVTEKSLRHPVYVRRRPDKNPKECTKETIFKE